MIAYRRTCVLPKCNRPDYANDMCAVHDIFRSVANWLWAVAGVLLFLDVVLSVAVRFA